MNLIRGGKLVLVKVVAVAGVLTIASQVCARTVGAYLGKPYPDSSSTCFWNDYEGILNQCPTAQNWCVPLVVDSGGDYTVTFTVRGQGQYGAVQCNAAGVDKTRQFVWAGTMGSSEGSDAMDIVSTGAYVPARGMLYACCNVPSNGAVWAINW